MQAGAIIRPFRASGAITVSAVRTGAWLVLSWTPRRGRLLFGAGHVLPWAAIGFTFGAGAS